MIKRMLLGGVLAAAISASALAAHCPADVAAIDNALAKSGMSGAKMAEVKALRDKGDAEHKAGNHGAAVNTLAEAMRMILNDM